MDNMKDISITKGIAESLKSQKPMKGVGIIECTVCGQELTNYISEEAGKGPVCRDKCRFTEKLKREEISLVEGKPEDFSTLNKVPHDCILRMKGEEYPRFANILKKDELWTTFLDRTEFAEFYDNDSEMSYTDATLKSLYQVPGEQVQSVSRICEPKSEMMQARFDKFKEEYNEVLNNRDNSGNFQFSGYSVKSPKALDEDQLENWKKFQDNYKNLKKNPTVDNNNRVKPKLASGEYPIATMMARLQNSTIPGSAEILAALQEQYPNIKPKDHGLTDKQLVHGLLIAVKKQEKMIFMSMLRGTNDFARIAKVYKELQKQITPELLKLFTDITT
jgi:hypothetical protein